VKILVISSFNDDKNGGGEIYAKNLAIELTKNGCQVSLVSCNYDSARENYSCEESMYKGFKIYRIILNQRADRFLYLHDQKIFDWFKQVFVKERPDIVHIHHLEGYCASIIDIPHFYHTAIVFTNHDWWLLCDRTFLVNTKGELCEGPYLGVNCLKCNASLTIHKTSLLQRVVKIKHRLISRTFEEISSLPYQFYIQHRVLFMSEVMNKIDIMICPSRFLANFFVQAGVSPGKILINGLGILGANPNFMHTQSETLRFGYMGRFHCTKGLDILFAAFSGVVPEKARLKLFGEPNEYIKRLLDTYPHNNIDLCGYINNDKLHEVFGEIDVLIVPSYYYENYPLTIQEAFLYHTPVIVSNIGGLAEAVQDKINGLYFDAGSSTDLRSKINLIIDYPESIAKLEKGIPQVKTLRTNCDEIIDIYKKLLNS
jgi:glycosyltransferase involved in cell wall biosynthesis